MKRFVSILANICLLTALVSICAVQASAASYAYSPEDALAYAEEHWDDGVGVCDQFVKACLGAGGVQVRAGGVKEVMDALLDAGYATGVQKLTTYKDLYIREEDNRGLVRAGDVIFFKCIDCDFYTHTVISSGYNQDGYLMTYGHNPACKDYLYHGTIHHSLDDGTLHENFEIYAVNMNTADPGHQHVLNKDLYETTHPHRMYDECTVNGCDVKYYLGWNATVRSCHVCNPSPNGKPVVTLSLNDRGVEVAWTALANVKEYQVWRGKSLDGTYFKITSTNSAYITNSSVTNGVTYYYKIVAVLDSGKEVVSDVVHITVGGELEKPVTAVTLNADGKPVVSWTAVDGANGYEVFRAAAANGSFTSMMVLGTGTTSYTNTGAEAGQTYWYKVCALFGDVTSESDVVSVTCTVPEEEEPPVPDKPEEPVLVAPVYTVGNNAEGKPTLKWAALEDAVSYQVYRCTTENGTYSKVFTTTGTSYTHASATAGKTYYYKVKAVFESGEELFGAVVSGTYQLPEVEEEIEIKVTTGNNAEGKPTMKWDAVSGAKSYQVYRCATKTGTYSKVFTTSGTSYTHTSAAVGKTYYYKLKVILNSGEEICSEIVSNTYRAPEVEEEIEIKIKITTGNNAEGKPTMKWDAVNGAKSYQVYRCTTKTGTYSKVFTTSGTSYTHTSATVGKTYYYKLKVILNSGEEIYSDIVSNTYRVPEIEEAVEIKITTSNNAAGKPTMKWNAIDGAESYQVYRCTSKNGTYSKVFTTTGTSYTHVSATAGKTYYYQLKVILADGGVEVSEIVTNTCRS